MADDDQGDAAFDALEDALVKGFLVRDEMVSLADLGPLMDAARAVLMIHRGVEPITGAAA